MLLRKNFKRDEVLLRVKNRLEASNLELRLRLMQHEVERRKGWLKREMGQIRECQQQCKRSSGDSVGIYWDLVLNSHFRSHPASGVAALSEGAETGSDANVSDQDQNDSDANLRWRKLQRGPYTDPKTRVTAIMQGKLHSNLAVPSVKIRKSGEGTRSARLLKIETETIAQRQLNNGRRKSFHDESELSKGADKDRTTPKNITNQNHLSNLCARTDVDNGNDHKEASSNRMKLPKIVTSSDSRSSSKTGNISVSSDTNETGSLDTKNKQNESPVLHISSKEPIEKEQSSQETVARRASLVPKQTIESSKGCTRFKLPIINTNLKSNPNIAEPRRKKGRTQNSREMTDIVARIASELKLESPSAFFGNLALTEVIPGKTKHTVSVGKANQDSSDPNDLRRPPNRLIQKGRFFPEHMSNSDISDDSKSQSSSADDSPYILYKGRKLRNYVKPQDRFRVDQVTRTWKKQQLFLKLLKNRPEDLTKCSLRWDPALGDSDSLQLSQPAKKKALERMVNENMSRPAPSRPETDHTELSSRVKAFMDSLGKNSDFFL